MFMVISVEYVSLGTLKLNTFDKDNKQMLEFLKKLIKDETIISRFQGMTVGLLKNDRNEFFGHGFLVTDNNEFVGYIGIGDYNQKEKSVYLRYAIDKEKRGKSYGKTLLNEITEHIFKNYSSIESIRLKIASDNKASLMTANSCGYKWLNDEFYSKDNYYIEKTSKEIDKPKQF